MRTGLAEKLIIWWRLKATPLDKILEFIPKNGKLLDLGCGFGVFPKTISQARPELEIIGIDPSEKRIGIAKKSINNPKIKFKKAVINDLDENDFNCIILIDVIYLLAQQELKDLLDSCFNKLIPRGVLIIKTMDERRRIRYAMTRASTTLSSLVYSFLIKFSPDNTANRILGIRRNKPNYLSCEELTNLLEKTGFSVETYDAPMMFIPYPHIIYVAKK